MPKHKANIVPVGMIDPTLTAQLEKLKALNRSPAQVTTDQVKTLYMMLYPLINSEFKHRDDLYLFTMTLIKALDAIFADLNAQASAQASIVQSHIHPHPMGPTAPMTASVTPLTMKNMVAGGMIYDTSEHPGVVAAGISNLSVGVAAGLSGVVVYNIRSLTPTQNVNTVGTPAIGQLLEKQGTVFVPFDIAEKDPLNTVLTATSSEYINPKTNASQT